MAALVPALLLLPAHAAASLDRRRPGGVSRKRLSRSKGVGVKGASVGGSVSVNGSVGVRRERGVIVGCAAAAGEAEQAERVEQVENAEEKAEGEEEEEVEEPTTASGFDVDVVRDGEPVTSLHCDSGRILRNVMKENKIEMYTTWGKLSNCGGAGNCGTCIVEVLEGAEWLSERTAAETKKLKNKPESWRLSCQAVVGDGEGGYAAPSQEVIALKPAELGLVCHASGTEQFSRTTRVYSAITWMHCVLLLPLPCALTIPNPIVNL
eukprot:jgi/Chlat1/5751/Chrsp38S05575